MPKALSRSCFVGILVLFAAAPLARADSPVDVAVDVIDAFQRRMPRPLIAYANVESFREEVRRAVRIRAGAELNRYFGFRNCAAYVRSVGVDVSRACLEAMPLEFRPALLVHEIFGWAGVGDRDYRYTAAAYATYGMTDDQFAFTGIAEALAAARYAGRFVAEGPAAEWVARGGGASGASGGGDEIEVMLKVTLVRATLARRTRFPDWTRSVLARILAVDVIADPRSIGPANWNPKADPDGYVLERAPTRDYVADAYGGISLRFDRERFHGWALGRLGALDLFWTRARIDEIARRTAGGESAP